MYLPLKYQDNYYTAASLLKLLAISAAIEGL